MPPIPRSASRRHLSLSQRPTCVPPSDTTLSLGAASVDSLEELDRGGVGCIFHATEGERLGYDPRPQEARKAGGARRLPRAGCCDEELGLGNHPKGEGV